MAELTDDQWNEFVNAIGDNTAATQMLARNLKAGGKKAGESLSNLGDTVDDGIDSFDAMTDQVRNTEDELASLNYAADRVADAWDGVIETSMAVTQAFANTTKDILANGESFGVMRSFIDPLADAMGMVIKGLGEVTAGAVGLGAAIPLVGGGFEGLANTIRGLSKIAAEVVTKLVKFGANLVIGGIEQLWGMFESAASAGVLFVNGLQEMNEQRGNLSLTTQEYTDVIKSNRNALTLLGGSVGEGAKRLAAVGKESKIFNEELRAMGITYKEQAENTAEFMASLNRSGQLRLMNDKQIAEASAEYQKNLAVMSSLTGKTIDTMKQERDEALKNMAFQAKLAKMDPAVRTEMEAALVSMPAGMQQAFKESVIFGKVMTDTGAIVSGASKYIEEFANSVASGAKTNKDAFQDFRNQIKENAPELRKRLGDLAAAGMAELLGSGNAVTKSINDFASALYNEITRAESGYSGAVDAMLSTGEKQEKSVKLILSGLDAQREMQDKMLKIIEEDALPAAGAMFKLISETMNEGLGDFIAFLKDPKAVAKKLEEQVTEMTIPTGKFGDAVDKTIVALAGFNKGMEDAVGFDMTDVLLRVNPITAPFVLAGDAMDAIGNISDWVSDSVGTEEERFSFTKTIPQQEKDTAMGASARGDRNIAKMREELAQLIKEKDTLPDRTFIERAAAGFDTRAEDIQDLIDSIEFMGEQQAITNARLKEANDQRAIGNRDAANVR